VIALHDHGRSFDSPTFAKELEKIGTHARGSLNLVIGGPYGLHKSILERANLVWSLSPLTYSHQLFELVVRGTALRAYSIQHGTFLSQMRKGCPCHCPGPDALRKDEIILYLSSIIFRGIRN